MKNNFWNSLPKPFFALAPMEDVTDIVFRQVVAHAARPDVFFTEFMNVSGFTHPNGRSAVARRLQFLPNEQPIVAQIWGNKPKDFVTTTIETSKMGFSGIDLNMGCPDKAVVKSGGGSALIENPNLAVEIIRSTADNTDLPVSVKTRLGAYRIDEWQEWLTTLLGQDLAALTVHLRTRKEMSKVPAHHELIPDIIKLRDQIAPDTKLVVNGDINNHTHGEQVARRQPGIDGLMIGRGVFADPFCFATSSDPHDKKELLELLRYHLDLFDKYEKIKYEPIKKFFKIYINNFPGAAELRNKLMETKNIDEARSILNMIE